MGNNAKILATAGLVAAGSLSVLAQEQNADSLALPQDSVATEIPIHIDQYAKYREAEKYAFALIALAENCFDEAYFCGVRWTILFGNTEHPDGTRVQKGEVIKDKSKAKDYVVSHFERRIYNQLDKFLQRDDLTPQQMGVLISLFYNVNPVSLTGMDDKGVIKKEPSTLIKMLNDGARIEDCADAFAVFNKSGGKEALGLIRRRTFEIMCFRGDINYEDILEARVNSIYFLNPYQICERKVLRVDKMPSQVVRTPKRDEASVNYVRFNIRKGNLAKVGEMLKEYNMDCYKQIELRDFEPLSPVILMPKGIDFVAGVALKAAKISR